MHKINLADVKSNILASITDDAKDVIDKMIEHDCSVYIVGGCVRAAISGAVCKDIDIATNVIPEKIIDIFGEKSHLVRTEGIKYGTVVVNGVEITTLRKDGEYSDNRRPDTVEYTNDVYMDLSRRDFTMNAIAYDIVNDELMDPFNGVTDIKNRIIRAVNDPIDRIVEDPLRMMRAIRFATLSGFMIDDKLSEGILENKELIKTISAERFQAELNKILLSQYGGFYLYIYSDLLAEYIPELQVLNRTKIKTEHSYKTLMKIKLESIMYSGADIYLSLALLLSHAALKSEHDHASIIGTELDFNENAEAAVNIMKRLRYDNDTIKKVKKIIKYQYFANVCTRPDMLYMLKLMGDDAKYVYLFDQAVNRSTSMTDYHERKSWYETIIRRLSNLSNSEEPNDITSINQLQIDGYVLKGLGVPDREIGNILNQLLDDVIYGRVYNFYKSLKMHTKQKYLGEGHV